MKVELVQFHVPDESLCLYEMNGPCGFAKKDRRLGIYLGEDDAHIWIYPISLGAVEGDPNQTPRAIIGSVMRFMSGTVVLQEPEDVERFGLNGTFSTMKYSAGSMLE